MDTAHWTIEDLQYWDAKIQEKAEGFGLRYFPVEFMMTSHMEMLGAMTYNGMPSHYPHWSYGKSFERLKTMYDHGVSGLPYEMVINSNPSLAYLMKDNSLALQMLTMAHVYGHVDFFANNFYFSQTHPEDTIARFKVHANRIRAYEKLPSVTKQSLEDFISAAHALAWNCNRNLSFKRLRREEQVERAIDKARKPDDPYERIHAAKVVIEPDTLKVPIEPDEDLLLFIRDYNPFLEEWQKDILTITWEENQYFVPMMETKIMNEGWASYWHKQIFNAIEAPEGVHVEFIKHNAQVVSERKYDLNPYYLGYRVWEDIDKRLGREAMFEARASERDTSFLRRFLTEELMRDMHLLEYAPDDEDYVVKHVMDDDKDHWKSIKEALISNTGMNHIPVIKVVDSNVKSDHQLVLHHYHDGRDLLKDYLAGTLKHVQQLWNRGVIIETKLDGVNVRIGCDEKQQIKVL